MADRSPRHAAEDALIEQLRRAQRLHEDAAANPILAGALARLANWQAQRLAQTYADLAAQPRYADAIEFFKSDLYGDADGARRDADAARVVPMMVMMLPERVIATIAQAMELNVLSHELDRLVLEALPRADGGFSVADYCRAYRRAGNMPQRQRQIFLLVEIGGARRQLRQETVHPHGSCDDAAAGAACRIRRTARLSRSRPATAAPLPYQGFGWISMVLVAADHRRRGIATRLLRRCIDDLIAAGRVPVLDATPAGREVYRKLGFNDTWGFGRWVLRERASPPVLVPAGIELRPIDEADWPPILAQDRIAFGADRAAVLRRLAARLPAAAWCAIRNRRVVGYLLGRDGRVASQLGPLVADDDGTAIALLARGLAAVPGPLYVDIRDEKAAVRDWLAGAGFTVERPLTRMIYGRTEAFGDAARVFAIAGPELG